MPPNAIRIACAGLVALMVGACEPGEGSGFVQIKLVPSSAATQPPLFLDAVKLEPVRKGETVLTRRSGTRKLQVEAPGGQKTDLCDIVVKKNRVTTVTVSVLERPPRCQCSHSSGAPAARTCVG